MSIRSLPSLIKQLYRYTHYTPYTLYYTSLLNSYKGNDWVEHIRYSPYTNSSLVIPLYQTSHLSLSLELIGVDNQSKFFLDHHRNYHIKVLDGKLKATHLQSVIGTNAETITQLDYNDDDQKAWLENHFVNHSSALIISHKTIKML
jgi:hypothetical protein